MSGLNSETTKNSAPTLVVVRNTQRSKKLSIRRLKAFAEAAVQALGRTGEVCFHLVSPREMARLNWQFLQHEGSTDVITFDQGSDPSVLRGEIYVSVADAVCQADEFATTWQDELCRYVIHGLLHLAGYDDLTPAVRRVMKREETRLLRRLSSAIPPTSIGIG